MRARLHCFVAYHRPRDSMRSFLFPVSNLTRHTTHSRTYTHRSQRRDILQSCWHHGPGKDRRGGGGEERKKNNTATTAAGWLPPQPARTTASKFSAMVLTTTLRRKNSNNDTTTQPMMMKMRTSLPWLFAVLAALLLAAAGVSGDGGAVAPPTKPAGTPDNDSSRLMIHVSSSGPVVVVAADLAAPEAEFLKVQPPSLRTGFFWIKRTRRDRLVRFSRMFFGRRAVVSAAAIASSHVARLDPGPLSSPLPAAVSFV